eukprot:gene12485-13662_t
MRAIEMKTLFAGVNYDAERNYQLHRKRLKEIKKSVDNDLPSSYEIRSKSPNKRSLGNKQAVKERIYRDNFFLAKRIFDIMEGESPLSEMINNTKHLDNHPGTMNFKVRLEEAQRIHYENMLLASRLNSVEPHYKNDELSVVRSVNPEKTPRTISPRSKKTRFLRELEYTLRMASPAGRYRASETYDQHGWSPNQLGAMTPADGDQSSRDDQMNENNVLRDQELKLGGRPRSIVLEYTKVQNGRVLDIAVVKEPYRDRYIIYGKDIEDGQRFELQLTSEDVSNILDGDILVTSVDNVEVWMALLHKIELEEVEQFSKIAQVPPPPEAEYSLIQDDAPPPQRAPHRVPNAPEAFLRPSEGVPPRGVGGKGNRRGKNTVIDNAIQAALANMAKYALDSLTAVKSEKKVEVEEEEVYEPLPEPEVKVEAEVLAVIDAYSNETEEVVETVETEEYVEKEVPPVPANTVDYHDNSVSFSASASTKMKITTTSHFPSVAVDKTTPASPLYRQLNPAFFPSKSTSEVVLGVPSVESVKSTRVKEVEVEEEQSERVVPVTALASTSYEERQSERAVPVAALASTSYDTRGAKEVEEDEEATVVPPPVAVKSASLDAKYDMAEDVSLSNGHEDSYSKEAFDEVRDAPSASRTNLVSRVKSRASAEEPLDDSYSKEAFDEEAFDEVRDEVPSASRAKLVSRAKSRASGDALDDSYNDDFESSQ